MPKAKPLKKVANGDESQAESVGRLIDIQISGLRQIKQREKIAYKQNRQNY